MNSKTGTLIAGVVIFLSTLVALVVLEVTKNDDATDTLLTLAGPVVAALLITGHVSSVTDQQNVKIDQITKQTNGMLDKRIEEQTMTALVKSGIVQAPQSVATLPNDQAAAANTAARTASSGSDT